MTDVAIRQHEWDLWQINGFLDHNISFKVLDEIRMKRVEAGLGPEKHDCIFEIE